MSFEFLENCSRVGGVKVQKHRSCKSHGPDAEVNVFPARVEKVLAGEVVKGRSYGVERQ